MINIFSIPKFHSKKPKPSAEASRNAPLRRGSFSGIVRHRSVRSSATSRPGMMRTDGLLSEYAPGGDQRSQRYSFLPPGQFRRPFPLHRALRCAKPRPQNLPNAPDGAMPQRAPPRPATCRSAPFVSDRTQSDRISGERGPAQGFGMGLVLGDKGPDDLPRGFGVVAGESRQSFEPANRILFRKTLLRGNPRLRHDTA